MTPITYSLKLAISLSLVMGAIQEKNGHLLYVDMTEDCVWYNGAVLYCGEEIVEWLKEHHIDTTDGWLPELVDIFE